MKISSTVRVAIDALLVVIALSFAGAYAYQSRTSFAATPEDMAMCRAAGDCTLLSEKRVGEVVEDIAKHAAQSGFLAGRKSCERGGLTL